MTHNYEEIAARVGRLVTEKQAAYGNSYGKSGEVLKALFPDGIPAKSYDEVLAIVRIVDKLFRLCTDPDYGGESPWRDICGYSLLRLADAEEKRKFKQPFNTHLNTTAMCFSGPITFKEKILSFDKVREYAKVPTEMLEECENDAYNDYDGSMTIADYNEAPYEGEPI